MCCLKCKKQGDGEFDDSCYKISIQNVGHAGTTDAKYEAKYNSSLHDFWSFLQ